MLCRWLELPISATLCNLTISKSNYGLSLILPSTKFIQCQTITRNALKSSPNSDIKYLWQDSNQGWRQEFSDGGLTLQTRGLKYGFQGTINAKILRKKSLFTFRRGASMLRRGAIAPSSPPLVPLLILTPLQTPNMTSTEVQSKFSNLLKLTTSIV